MLINQYGKGWPYSEVNVEKGCHIQRLISFKFKFDDPLPDNIASLPWSSTPLFMSFSQSCPSFQSHPSGSLMSSLVRAFSVLPSYSTSLSPRCKKMRTKLVSHIGNFEGTFFSCMCIKFAHWALMHPHTAAHYNLCCRLSNLNWYLPDIIPSMHYMSSRYQLKLSWYLPNNNA